MITGTIYGTTCDRLYHEVGLKSLADRIWSHRLFYFRQIKLGLLPLYLKIYDNGVSKRAFLNLSIAQNKNRPITLRTIVFEI